MKKLYAALLLIFGVFANGQDFDTSFNGSGYLLLPPYHINPNDYEKVLHYVSLPDGKIILLKIRNGVGGYKVHMSKYNVDGSIDTNFGNNGNVIFGHGGLNTLYLTYGGIAKSDFFALNDGRMVLFPSSGNGALQYFVFNPDGSINNITFSNSINVGDILVRILHTPDDKFLFLGWSTSHNYIVKLNNDFTLDTTFATNGRFTYTGDVTYHSTDICVSGNSIFSSRKIVVNSIVKTEIIKLNYSNGVQDTGFGIRYLNFLIDTIKPSIDGNLFAVKSTSYSPFITRSGISVIKMDNDLNMINSFAIGGELNPNMKISSLNEQLDGKIVLSGKPLDNSHFVLKRYTSNGQLDTDSFSSGIFESGFGPYGNVYFPDNDLVIQNDGKYLFCTQYQYTDDQSYYGDEKNAVFLARLNPQGFHLLENQGVFLNDFKSYPNPFSDKINISFDLMQNDYINADLYDLQGRLIKKVCKDQLFSSGNKEIEITDLDDIAIGQYLLKLNNSSGPIKTVKVIKE